MWLLGVAGGGPRAQEEQVQSEVEVGVLQAETRWQGGCRNHVSPVPRSLMHTPPPPHRTPSPLGGHMHRCPGPSNRPKVRISTDLLQCLSGNLDSTGLKWALDHTVPQACPFCIPNSG